MPRRNRTRNITLTLAFGIVLSLTPAFAAETGTVTVGDLTLRLAEALGVVWDDDPAPEVARAALEDLGIDVPGELGHPLREQDAVAILGQAGLSLTTSNPERRLGAEEVDRIFGLMFVSSPGMATTVESGSDHLKKKIRRFCHHHPGHRVCRIIASHFRP